MYSVIDRVSILLTGDILGCYLNVEEKTVIFSLNGDPLPPMNQIFHKAVYVSRTLNSSMINYSSSLIGYIYSACMNTATAVIHQYFIHKFLIHIANILSCFDAADRSYIESLQVLHFVEKGFLPRPAS